MLSSQQFAIKEIKDKEIWESFLLGVKNKTFLQSWNWGEFQKAMGDKVWRLGVYRGQTPDDELVAVAQVIKVAARRGRFLLVPHGPIMIYRYIDISKYRDAILRVLVAQLKNIAKQEKCIFIRIVPIWERNEENKKIFRDLGSRPAPIHTHPELTWVLDLTPSEDELLMQMRKTTRYLIKQGLKNKELEILKSQDVNDVEVFNKLYQETVVRHHFVPFSLKYLENEFLAFSGDPSASPQDDDGRSDAIIFLAKYRDEDLASAIVIFWQGIAFYHQGASSQKESKIPASYLLQWEAIKEAKNRGCKTYNFWGIADTRNIEISKYRKHPWAGLTLFKTGFGGYKKEYLQTQDLPLSRRYWLTYIIETFRKKKRGF